MSSFKDQFERVNRYLKRIQSEDQPTIDYLDDLYSFFINCHHLKDWVKKDKSTGLTKNEVEDFVQSKLSLRICADLANASKHVTPERRLRKKDKRPQDNAHITNRNATISIPLRRTIYQNIVTLQDGSKHIAENIARQAVDDWTQFLSTKNLI